jgi:hypothetical protein
VAEVGEEQEVLMLSSSETEAQVMNNLASWWHCGLAA